MSFPPTIVVRHKKENPKKCTILPLKGRDDIVFYHHPVSEMPDLTNYVRLAADGPPLVPDDRQHGILLLDGSWRRADEMTRAFEHVAPRSLSGYVTAYPRVSKLGTDPDNGLASIEALYIAYRLLDRPTAGLLYHYHWAERFLELNHFG
jgi:pre-rRNA-processing protein TSR3